MVRSAVKYLKENATSGSQLRALGKGNFAGARSSRGEHNWFSKGLILVWVKTGFGSKLVLGQNWF